MIVDCTKSLPISLVPCGILQPQPATEKRPESAVRCSPRSVVEEADVGVGLRQAGVDLLGGHRPPVAASGRVWPCPAHRRECKRSLLNTDRRLLWRCLQRDNMLASQLLLPLTDIDPAFIARSQAHRYIVNVRIARPSAILHERLLVTRRRASLAGRPEVGSSSCWASPRENAIESSNLHCQNAGVDYTRREKTCANWSERR